MALHAGKLPPELLRRIVATLPPGDPRVIVGPGTGRDAAVVAVADRYLVIKTDPITFATDDIGWYAVQVNANDVACLGARPLWFMLTSLLPVGCPDTLPQQIVAQVLEACTELGIAFLGGHTEMTIGIDRPIVSGVMIGEAAPEELVRPERARSGDAILLTKGIALEGASLIARERESVLLSRGVDPALLTRAKAFLRNPGINVLREARMAAAAGASVLHDPTEGGLATALWELCEATNLGAQIDRRSIPIIPEAKALCDLYQLDPLGAIASGALLIGIAAAKAGELIGQINQVGIACTRIGEFREANHGVRLDDAPMPRFDSDELTKVFGD